MDITNNSSTSDANSLWEVFKTRLINSVESNIPSKMLTYRHRLPWIHDILRKLINRKKLNCQKRRDSKYANKYKNLKAKVQKEQREAY